MANVNSTRMRVVLVDDMTAPLIRMQEALNGFNSVLKGVGTGGGQSLSSVNKKVNELNTSVQLASKGFTKMGASIGLVLTAYENFGRLSSMLGNSFGQVFDYAKELQTNTIGVAGILSSMADINGKQMQWNEALNVSKDIMKELKSQALQTAATSKDLMNTFRAILGPGLAKGMDINQILDFTKVGVNAVKSLGLNDVQLVQELRSILQGNIRDASSTLATALGITNQDIKDAQNKVGGVYEFLMERMKGFKDSTIATTKTMAGQFEIAKEAIIVAGQEGSESLLQNYSNALAKINEMLLVKGDNGHLIVNPKIVDTMKNVADTFDVLVTKGIEFTEFVYNKFEMLAYYIGSFVVLPKILDMASSSAGVLGEKFLQVYNFLDTTTSKANALRQNTLTVIELADKELLQLQTKNKLQRHFFDLLGKTYSSSIQLGNESQNLFLRLKELGLSHEESLKRTIQYMDALKRNQKDVADSILKSTEEAEKFNQTLNKTPNYLGKIKESGKALYGVMQELSGVLSSVGFAILSITDEENKNTRECAEWMIKIDLAANAIFGMVGALKTACEWLKKFQIAQKMALIFSGPKGWAVLAAAGAMVGLMKTDFDLSKPLFGGYKSSKDLREDIENRKKYEENPYIFDDYGTLDDYNKIKVGNITTHYTRTDTDNSQKGKSKSPQDIANEYQSFITSIRNTTSALNENQSAFDKTMEGAEKQLDTWQKKLDKMKQTGLLSQEDYDKAKTLMSNYFNDMIVKANEAQEKQNESLMKLHVEQAQLTMELGRGGQAEEYKLMNESLQVEKAYYEDKLNNKQLEIEERIRLEKEYASVVKQIRDNNMYDYKTAWRATLEELSQQQINYGDSIKSVFSTIESAGTNLLTSTENFGTKIKTFFSDVAASIMSEMAKIIMKGLITNAILSMIGMGYKGKSYSDLTKMPISNYGPQLPGKATGGYASGWTIVGEQGPELVNFTNPGRVYTAQQTANALKSSGNGNGNINIKFDIKNETGTQIEAQQTGSSFDGESYVIGVVLKAMANNTNGMRTIVKGLANA